MVALIGRTESHGAHMRGPGGLRLEAHGPVLSLRLV
jgi:hypothetical protein